jgi:hypothetical protein
MIPREYQHDQYIEKKVVENKTQVVRFFSNIFCNADQLFKKTKGNPLFNADIMLI